MPQSDRAAWRQHLRQEQHTARNNVFDVFAINWGNE
jgi:hypothetical protein